MQGVVEIFLEIDLVTPLIYLHYNKRFICLPKNIFLMAISGIVSNLDNNKFLTFKNLFLDHLKY